jgi:hypothetical protein
MRATVVSRRSLERRKKKKKGSLRNGAIEMTRRKTQTSLDQGESLDTSARVSQTSPNVRGEPGSPCRRNGHSEEDMPSPGSCCGSPISWASSSSALLPLSPQALKESAQKGWGELVGGCWVLSAGSLQPASSHCCTHIRTYIHTYIRTREYAETPHRSREPICGGRHGALASDSTTTSAAHGRATRRLQAMSCRGCLSPSDAGLNQGRGVL